MTLSRYQKYKASYQAYYLSHQEKIKEYRTRYKSKRKSTEWNHIKRFGGLRELVLKRDNYSCVKCGMTREQHKVLWKRDITVDHINNKGRYTKEPDNRMENLQTLCLRCHGKKDHENCLVQNKESNKSLTNQSE